MKKLSKLILPLTILSLLMTGCNQSSKTEVSTSAQSNQTTIEKTVIDANGNKVTLPKNIKKIAVTPMPWASVIWGLEGNSDRLVSMNPSSLQAYNISVLSQLDKSFGNISTKEIGEDFSINMEEMANIQPDIMFLWNDQTKEAEKLTALGITPIMLVYATDLDTLTKDIRIVGQSLGKEDLAENIIKYHSETEQYFKNKSSELTNVKKNKVLYLTNVKNSVASSGESINNYLINLTGGENVAGSLSKSNTTVTMEQILAWDPEIIYISNFDTVLPSDFYNNTIEGQDWSNISAVKNHKVYKTPIGIYRWDAPCIETPLMMKWMAQVQQPEIFSDYNFTEELKNFYKEYFNHELSENEIDWIKNTNSNKNSK